MISCGCYCKLKQRTLVSCLEKYKKPGRILESLIHFFRIIPKHLQWIQIKQTNDLLDDIMFDGNDEWRSMLSRKHDNYSYEYGLPSSRFSIRLSNDNAPLLNTLDIANRNFYLQNIRKIAFNYSGLLNIIAILLITSFWLFQISITPYPQISIIINQTAEMAWYLLISW